MDTKNDILIIDDDEDLVEALTTILEARGYKVRSAFNGTTGIDAIKEEIPDLVVLDIMMDTIDEGINVSRDIRRSEKWKNIPVIGLSGIAHEVPIDIGSDEEMYPVDIFMEKPVVPDVFINEIERLISGK